MQLARKVGLGIAATAMLLGAIVLVPALRVAAAVPGHASTPPNILSPEEEKAGWILLFDGKTTNGWRAFGQQKGDLQWNVVDGTLACSGKSGNDLMTIGQYGSFELSLEYNIATGGNSGVMFHVADEGKYPWMSGPEVQIVDDKGGHDPQLSGWIYDLYPSKVDATKAAGQWNALRIVVTPQKCETYVNGAKYYEFVKGNADWKQRVAKSKFARYPNFGKADHGHIALQDHNSPVRFRSIKIRYLSEK